MNWDVNTLLSAIDWQHSDNTLIRGIEKENLRMSSKGMLSKEGHPLTYGKTLTHPFITTDFAESLLEMITPPVGSSYELLSFVEAIEYFLHKHSPQHERLWPYSMPPWVDNMDDVPIAQYGPSAAGQMKEIYRRGLTYRYGKPMQLISGIHYNVSYPDDFFRAWGQGMPLVEAKNDFYMNLIRHFLNNQWLLCYLWGASPMCTEQSIVSEEQKEALKPIGNQTFSAPFGTSLRLGELGYHNVSQHSILIDYNSVQGYVECLNQLTSRPYQPFTNIGIAKHGQRIQINDALLQIENEFYSSIRPKQPPASGQRPIQALYQQGTAYCEVRIVDLNPLEPMNICCDQLKFTDVFLLFCGLQPKQHMALDHRLECRENLLKVASHGRKPNLSLRHHHQNKDMTSWANELIEHMIPIAQAMDQHIDNAGYESIVTQQLAKLEDPDLTPSAQVLEHFVSSGLDYNRWGMSIAEQNRTNILKQRPNPSILSLIQKATEQSIIDYDAIDLNLSVESFIENYFTPLISQQIKE